MSRQTDADVRCLRRSAAAGEHVLVGAEAPGTGVLGERPAAADLGAATLLAVAFARHGDSLARAIGEVEFFALVFSPSSPARLSALGACVDRRGDVVRHVGAAGVQERAAQPTSSALAPAPEVLARHGEDDPRIEDTFVRLCGEHADVAREEVTAPAAVLHGVERSNALRARRVIVRGLVTGPPRARRML